MMTHTHTCAICGYVWTCDAPRKRNGKSPNDCTDEIEKAAKVNGTGPYCQLCYHVEFAKRIARARGVSLWINQPAPGAKPPDDPSLAE